MSKNLQKAGTQAGLFVLWGNFAAESILQIADLRRLHADLRRQSIGYFQGQKPQGTLFCKGGRIMRTERVVRSDGLDVFVFMRPEVGEYPPPEAIRSAHPGSWMGRAAQVTLGPAFLGYHLIIHPWTKITDPDYRQDRIGQIRLRPNHPRFSGADFENSPFGGSWRLEWVEFPRGWESHLPALSPEEWLSIKSQSSTLLGFHIEATKRVLQRLSPTQVIDLMNLWGEKKATLLPFLREKSCIRTTMNVVEAVEYPDTPGCLFLMLLSGYKHHLSGTAMWQYLQGGYGRLYASKLLELCREWGVENELPIYIYPPLAVTMVQKKKKGEVVQVLPPPPESLVVGELLELPFRGVPSQYTLLI